jgi:hypothetical protein
MATLPSKRMSAMGRSSLGALHDFGGVVRGEGSRVKDPTIRSSRPPPG